MTITINNQSQTENQKSRNLQATSLINQQQWSYLRKKYQMTRRELQIAQLVCCGLSNEQTADQLGVKLGTVKTHIRNLYRKLWVHNKISMLLRFIDDAGVINNTTDDPIDIMIGSQSSSMMDDPSLS